MVVSKRGAGVGVGLDRYYVDELVDWKENITEVD